MSDRSKWGWMSAVVLTVGIVGCMEESPELMMEQNGQVPPPPGQGQPPQGAPAPGPPSGQAPQADEPAQASGQADGERKEDGEGRMDAEGEPNGAPSTLGQGAGEAAGADSSAPAGGSPPPGTRVGDTSRPAGEGGQPGGGAPTGDGAPPIQPEAGGQAAQGESEPGLLARLFSSQDAPSAPAGTTLVQPSDAGPKGIPRVLETVEDKPQYALSDLETSPDAVRLKGSVSCSVCKDKVLINVVSSKGLIVSASGIEPGHFDIPVPRGIGDVTVTAIGDDNGDGLPTKGEPLGGYMKNPVNVGGEDVEGITIEIGKSLPPPATE